MKDYSEYMDHISADPALQERIMNRAGTKARPPYLRRTIAGLAAGVAVVLLGVLVIPGLLNARPAEIPENQHVPDTPQVLDDRPAGDGSDTVIVVDPYDPYSIARPGIPVPDRVALTLDEARHDPNFGTFIPAGVPDGFVFESAHYSEGILSVSWNRGIGLLDHISWVVHASDDQWESNVVDASQRELFDIALYPMPWMYSVPEEIQQVFHFPVFLAQELSLDIVRARMQWEEAGDGRLGAAAGWRHAPFAVLFGDVLVQPRVNGVAPEQLWEMLEQLIMHNA